MNEENKRGQNAATAGLVLQAVLAGVFFVVWLLTGTLAAQGVFIFNAAALLVWTISVALFYCRRLAELEAEELADLAESEDRALFGGEGGAVPLAQRRLRMIQRWLAPTVALLLGLGLLLGGIWLGRPLVAAWPSPAPVAESLMWAFFCLGASFLGFLFSRYALGMAKTERWRLLRAGGGFMTVSILLGALLCGAFFLDHLRQQWGLQVLPYVTAALMVMLGIELLTNFILDFYRPRKPDVEPRPSFDSRLANLLSEPGDIAHSVADAMNYQFGFEVSSTWFYQLLRNALLPLALFGVFTLVAISAVVVVGPGQEAVVLTFGAAAPSTPTLSEGTHLKWPWPIQSVDLVDTDRIRTFIVGVDRPDEADAAADHGHQHRTVGPDRQRVKLRTNLMIWTEEHRIQELDFLTAREMRDEDPEAGDPLGAFGLIRMVFNVQYRVTDVYRYRYGVSDPASVLYGLAMRELTLYTAQRDVDRLMQRGAGRASRDLRDAIAEGADALDLGVEIVAVTVQGVHPLPKVADAFEEVIKAEQEGKGAVLAAGIQADRLLTIVAGSKRSADTIMEALDRVQRLQEQDATGEEVAAADQEATSALDRSGGQAKVLINQARAERWATVNAERGRWASYSAELTAFRAAPRLYTLESKLRVLSGQLATVKKMILGVDRDLVEIRYQDDQRAVGGGITIDTER